MQLILLFSYVNAGMNFADSIYSATVFLSMAMPIPRLFPIIDKIAFEKPDKTMEYSSLIYGAKTKYDAINAYETLVYMNFPEVMNDEQKGNMTKSLYFIKDVQSPEIGSYCRSVYERLHERYGTFLNLEPLATTTTELETSIHSESAESEIILEKRSDINDDILADDIVDRYTPGSQFTPELADKMLANFKANLLVYRTIGKVQGNDIFLAFNTSQTQVSDSSEIQTTETKSEIIQQQSEIILEKRGPDNSDMANFKGYMQRFSTVFHESRSQNTAVRTLVNAGNSLGIGSASASVLAVNALEAASVVAANAQILKVDPTYAVIDSWDSDTKRDALKVFFNLEFASSFAGASPFSNTLLKLADIYGENPETRLGDYLSKAIEFEENKDLYMELLVADMYEGEKIKGRGLTKFLLTKLENEIFRSIDFDTYDSIKHNVGLLNKMSYLTGQDQLDVDIDGLVMHEFKETLGSKNRYIPRKFTDKIKKLKTPVDRLQEQIDILVSNPMFTAETGTDVTDPVNFFKMNIRPIRNMMNRDHESINNMNAIVHSLSNITKLGFVGEDIKEIGNILIGDGVENHGLLGDSSNSAFKIAAKKLRDAPKNQHFNSLHKNIRVNTMITARVSRA